MQEIGVTANYDDTTFFIPFRDNNYNLISYREILNYINANLPDNRPIIPTIYVGTPLVRRARMTSDNYHLAEVSRGILIMESLFVPSPISHAFLCEFCGSGTDLFNMDVFVKHSRVMAFCDLSCQRQWSEL
jgi:hypothetical protein